MPGWRTGLLSALLLSTMLTVGRLATADEGEPLDPPTRLRVIDDTGEAIQKNFAHWEALPDFDFDRRFTDYRSAALDAPDRRSFSLLTQAFVASLGNGHTQFNDDALFRADPGNLGIALRFIGSAWVVTRSRRANLSAGTVVTAIDGKPFEDFFRQSKVQLSASNERTRRTILSSYPFLFPLRSSLTLADGTQVAIDRTQALTMPPAPAKPIVTHRWLDPGKVGYLAIGSFDGNEHEAEARRIMVTDFAKAATLVIDLRGNGGGRTPSALGRHLLDAEWRRWRTTPPSVAVADKPRPLPSASRYIVIIDRGCASACEDFAMPFSMSARAILVGEVTAGSSGQPSFTDWGNGMKLWVGSRRQWFPDGREFEGVGVRPDVPVALTPEDFRRGAVDVMLACAQTIARGDDDNSCRK